MLRDVFYFNQKPNAHPREKFAESLEDARQQCTTDSFWIINEFCDYRGFDWDFDFEFLPDEDVWAEEHNNVWPSQHQKDSGTWLCPREHSDVIIYRGDVNPVTRRNINNDNWVELDLIDHSKFDFSWHPDPADPPYIYKWGCKYFPAQLKHVLEYHVDGATDAKYMNTIVELIPEEDRWVEVQAIDKHTFDMTWRPDPREPPYIYTWGNKHISAELKPTLEYHAPGATERKYMDNTVGVLPEWDRWEIPDTVSEHEFDFSWRPNPHDPDFIYEFGTQWQTNGGPCYVIPGATEIKYVDDQKAVSLPCMDNWVYDSSEIDVDSFDFSWHPDNTEEPYIYVFGNQWYPAEEMPTVRYVMGDATEVKYVHSQVAKLVSNMDNWTIPSGVDTTRFDFSWVPHPMSPPYIYQFGTLQDPLDGPIYTTPNTNGETVRVPIKELEDIITVKQYYIETTLEDLVNEHPDELFWALRKNIDYTTFDFDWRPGIVEISWELNYVHVFGSPDSELTQSYFVSAKNFLSGETDFKFVEELKLSETNLSQIFVKPDIFYVDKGNPESQSRFDILKSKFGTRIQKTRYLNSWVDTINRCTNRATSGLIWVLNSELEYSDFDFDYYPNPWQMKMVHVFGTQWSHWGTTFMINCETFAQDTKYIKIIEHLSNLNFVKTNRAKATACVHDVVMIDHGNTELLQVSDQVEQKAARKLLDTILYEGSYLNTLKNFIKQLPEKKEHYLWICSSVCDYSQFDFTYVCDPFSKDNLHVFPSDTQKFGDTFFIDVNKTKEIIDELEKLEEYHKVNFNGATRSSRLPEPIIVSRDDMHMNVLDNITGFPYATIIASDNLSMVTSHTEPMNLWSSETKNIIITSTGATRIIVPAEAKGIVKKELYDYPYVKRMPKLTKSAPLDIVFVSNGETVADQNYEHLLRFTDGLPNKIHRVDGINGRTEALHAAAESSKTPWFFCIPAKLLVNKNFDWSYQADRMQQPKHYIFNALNPVNDLCYGHQSMVLYNKNLVLGNEGVGLDFTLDSLHMSVDLISGTASGDTDEYSTWRTAFREAVKLKCYSETGDAAAITRLDVWTSVGKGSYGEWSIIGALDGIEFYDEAGGDLAALRQSYHWDWLKARYESKY